MEGWSYEKEQFVRLQSRANISDKNQRLIAQIAISKAIGLIISQPQRPLVWFLLNKEVK